MLNKCILLNWSTSDLVKVLEDVRSIMLLTEGVDFCSCDTDLIAGLSCDMLLAQTMGTSPLLISTVLRTWHTCVCLLRSTGSAEVFFTYILPSASGEYIPH